MSMEIQQGNHQTPVPVIKEYKIDFAPGGAGNIAMNLKSLGANVSCLGYIGKDAPGEELIKYLKAKELIINIFIKKKSKQRLKRYFSNNKQILRIDHEEIVDNWKPHQFQV